MLSFDKRPDVFSSLGKVTESWSLSLWKSHDSRSSQEVSDSAGFHLALWRC